jgi:hypothetical protein
MNRQIFEKKTQNFYEKSVKWEPQLFHVDGRTDMTQLVVDCCNFAVGP